MTREIIEKYELDGNNVKIIYTDGSKTEGRSVGAAIMEEEQEEAVYVTMNKRCLVYIAEMFAVAKAIQKNRNENKDLIIYSNAKSAVEDLMDNRLTIYKNMYKVEGGFLNTPGTRTRG